VIIGKEVIEDDKVIILDRVVVEGARHMETMFSAKPQVVKSR
jgi:hypothetical protein